MATKHNHPEVRERELLRPLAKEIVDTMKALGVWQEAEVTDVDASNPGRDVIRVNVVTPAPARNIKMHFKIADKNDGLD